MTNHVARGIYNELRAKGRLTLSPDQFGLIPSLRAHGKAEGYQVVAGYTQGTKGLNPHQVRTRPKSVSLTSNGVDIVRPGALS